MFIPLPSFRVWMSVFVVLLVWQEIEFINMETKLLLAPGAMRSTRCQDSGALSRQSAFVIGGFQPPSHPFKRRTWPVSSSRGTWSKVMEWDGRRRRWGCMWSSTYLTTKLWRVYKFQHIGTPFLKIKRRNLNYFVRSLVKWRTKMRLDN